MGVLQRIERAKQRLDSLVEHTASTDITAFYGVYHRVVTEGAKDIDLPSTGCILDKVEYFLGLLGLAKETCDFVAFRLIPTNRPISLTRTRRLEQTRAQINVTELLNLFGVLKKQRETVANNTGYDDIKLFSQAAYRKGTGMNIRAWAQYMLKVDGKPKYGNCTEHANAGFAYLYSRFREVFCENSDKVSNKETVKLFEKIERVDVSNQVGGHSFLLLNRKNPPGSEALVAMIHSASDLQTLPSMSEFLDLSKEFGNDCIVIDPWNKDNPFYPASDLKTKLPKCAREGRVNIEFALDFSQQLPPRGPTP